MSSAASVSSTSASRDPPLPVPPSSIPVGVTFQSDDSIVDNALAMPQPEVVVPQVDAAQMVEYISRFRKREQAAVLAPRRERDRGAHPQASAYITYSSIVMPHMEIKKLSNEDTALVCNHGSRMF